MIHNLHVYFTLYWYDSEISSSSSSTHTFCSYDYQYILAIWILLYSNEKDTSSRVELLYMYNVKTYVKSELDFDTLIHLLQIYSEDNGMSD